MKSITKLLFVTIILALVMVACTRTEDKKLDIEKFKLPPQSSKVHTWWHWMNGRITKDGITRDLEAMKQQGISQATILNIGLFEDRKFDVPEVKFNTPEWYDMFSYALDEADRLNIKIGVHNCDGWSSSGGPWITPEHAMKQITWNKSVIEGGKKINRGQ